MTNKRRSPVGSIHEASGKSAVATALSPPLCHETKVRSMATDSLIRADLVDLTDLLVEHAAVTTALDGAIREQLEEAREFAAESAAFRRGHGGRYSRLLKEATYLHRECARVMLGVRGILRRTQRDRERARRAQKGAA